MVFHAWTAAHDCRLFNTLRCCILDGKWSIQTPVCNERGCGFEWNSNLQVGYFRGCTLRPQPGAKFCKKHDEHCCLPIEDTSIQSHREVQASGTGRFEYLAGDTWKHADEVPVSHIRAYELGLLRPRQRKELLAEAGSCLGLRFSTLRSIHPALRVMSVRVTRLCFAFLLQVTGMTAKECRRRLSAGSPMVFSRRCLPASTSSLLGQC